MAANALAAAGASAVFFADIDLARAQKAAVESRDYATDPSYQAFALHVDVANATSVENMVLELLGQTARIDYLVHAAGVSSIATS